MAETAVKHQMNTIKTPDKHQVELRSESPGFLNDANYRAKVMHTMYLALTFISLGLVVGQIGPTFLDLQLITGTNLEQASAFFTGSSIGYLTGSVIGGAIYSRVNKNGLMFCGTFSMGIISALTAYCSPYGLMIFIRILCGMTAGFVDTVGNSEQMRIWGTEGQGLMQMLHFSFALGGVISPLYSAPFLALRSDEDESLPGSSNGTTAAVSLNTHSAYNNLSTLTFSTTPGSSNMSNASSQPLALETNVHYAFLITGVFSCLSGVPFFILLIRDMTSKKTLTNSSEMKVQQRKLPVPLFLFILFNLCLFYILYCCVEDTFASFLMTFLIREYSSISKARGAYTTAIYWASFATSRFSMIFVSKLLNAVRLLYLCLTLMIIAFTSFFISAMAGEVLALTVFAAMAGLSMSAVFPAGFLWTETELLRVTGPISSCILISASVGTMINPLILAYLMEEFSNMWFCYLLVAETILLSCLFLFLLTFNRCYVNNRFGPLEANVIESTISADELESKEPLQLGSDKGVV